MKKNAFGNPDGARASINSIICDYIEAVPQTVAIKIKANEFLSTRVIVGAKGSGKTHYLRLIRSRILKNESVVTFRIENESPDTDLVIQFSQNYEKKILSEKWMNFWDRVILLYVASYLIFDKCIKEKINTETIDEIIRILSQLKIYFKKILALKDYANIILSQYGNNVRSMNDFLLRIEWAELKAIFYEIIKSLPPLYFFIDSVDEEYERAPAYWVRCQKGLFYSVMHMLREEEIGEKLHIIICLRDNVFSTILRSEHASKFINEAHILRLNWNYDSISNFFNRKIQKLEAGYFINSNSSRSLSNWIGIDKINNIKRNIEEELESYVIRHTRLVPRDIVILGNELTELTVNRIQDKNTLSSKIREIISNNAKVFGSELLTICAKQVTIDSMPSDAVRNQYASTYTSVDEYHESNYLIIKNILSQFNKDKLIEEDIIKIEEDGRKHFNHNCSLTSILWINGVIGYRENDYNNKRIYRFYSFNNEADNLLPKGKGEYGFRSCIIDCLGISSLDNIPVI